MIFTPLRKNCFSASFDIPPVKLPITKRVPLINYCKTVAVCIDNSRVGLIIINLKSFLVNVSDYSKICSINGIKNANVFPLPVIDYNKQSFYYFIAL